MLCPLYRQERTQLRQDPALSAPSCLWYSYGFTPQALHNNLIKTQAELVHQMLLISQLSFLQSVAATQPHHAPNLSSSCSLKRQCHLSLPSLSLALHRDGCLNHLLNTLP